MNNTVDRPLVVAIVLNWNGASKTIDCARSVLTSRYDNLSVIIVDNGSADDSVQRLEAATLEATLLRSSRNLGFGGGMNLGIAEALRRDASFVWILNNDTRVDPDCLNALVGKALTDPRIGIVGAAIYEDDESSISYFGGGSINFCLGISRVHRRVSANDRLDYVGGASMLVRRDVFVRAGLFAENDFFMFWEDADLSVRASRGGFTLCAEPTARLSHVGSASFSGNGVLLDEYFSASLVRFLRKYSRTPRLSVVLALAIRVVHRLLQGKPRQAAAFVRGALKRQNVEIVPR